MSWYLVVQPIEGGIRWLVVEVPWVGAGRIMLTGSEAKCRLEAALLNDAAALVADLEGTG